MIVREVADALGLVAEAIKNTREIVKAISDGRQFLKRYHPEAKQDLTLLLEEVTKSLNGLVQVSKVVTGFQFTVAGAGRDLEPSRFNNYVIQSKADLQLLHSHIGDLRASCSKVNEHLNALNERAGTPWWGWVDLLGEKREQRRQELADTIHQVYGADEDIIRYVTKMMEAAEITLREVGLALGSATAADPKNVPVAAKLLAEYASHFKKLEDDCREIVDELRSQISGLR